MNDVNTHRLNVFCRIDSTGLNMILEERLNTLKEATDDSSDDIEESNDESEDEEDTAETVSESDEIGLPPSDESFELQPIIPIKRKVHSYGESSEIEAIFQRFACSSQPFTYREIAHQSNIPPMTIYGWHKKFKEDQTWRPSHENMSQKRRIFHDEEEAQITCFLEDEYIAKNRLLTYEIVQRVIMNHIIDDMEPHSDGIMTAHSSHLGFKCSRQFIRNFLKRNGLSNRVYVAERRPEVDPKEVEVFHRLLKEAFDDPNEKVILNADESNWRVLMPPKRSIVKRGQDSVHVNINGDKRSGFTILATISSEGKKYPLGLFASGTTPLCHRQLESHPKYTYKVFHSMKGWITEQTFIEYLEWIRSIEKATTIYLVIGQYGAYFGPKVPS